MNSPARSGALTAARRSWTRGATWHLCSPHWSSFKATPTGSCLSPSMSRSLLCPPSPHRLLFSPWSLRLEVGSGFFLPPHPNLDSTTFPSGGHVTPCGDAGLVSTSVVSKSVDAFSFFGQVSSVLLPAGSRYPRRKDKVGGPGREERETLNLWDLPRRKTLGGLSRVDPPVWR